MDHGVAPRSVDTATEDCAVHMTVDAFTFGRRGDCLGTVDVLVSPPASQGLAHTALGALKPLPIEMKTVSKNTKDFAKGEIPNLVPASHTQGPHVLMFCVCLSTTVILAWARCPDPATPR